MKLNLEVDLDELYGYDGDSITSVIADEIVEQVKRKVRAEMKKDPAVERTIKAMKDAAMKKFMEDLK